MCLKDSGKHMDNSGKSRGQLAIWISNFFQALEVLCWATKKGKMRMLASKSNFMPFANSL